MFFVAGGWAFTLAGSLHFGLLKAWAMLMNVFVKVPEIAPGTTKGFVFAPEHDNAKYNGRIGAGAAK